MPSTIGHWRLGGHVKDLGGNAKSSRSNQTFGTNNYLAPEAYELRRLNKIAHLELWLHPVVRAVQFGKVVQHSQSR
jgi:hypothetical protein